MLELMRKHARNWIMKVLLGIIIIVFVFYFGSTRGRQKADAVASLDGRVITYADVAKEYNNLINLYRQQLGGALNDDLLKQLNLKQAALDNLVQQAIIVEKAREMNLIVSDEEVRSSIMAMPAFRRGGDFDEKTYQQALRHNKLTPEDFERMQKESLTISRFLSLVQEGVKVSEQDVYDLYRLQKERVNVRYLQLSPDDFRSKVTVQEKDLETYLKEHDPAFRIPEQIQVKYLKFKGEDFASAVDVTEAEIKDFFERHSDQFKTANGKRPDLSEVRTKIVAEIRQINGMRAAAGAAKKAHDTIYQDEKFDEYAAKNKLTVNTSSPFPVANPPAELSGIGEAAQSLGGLQKKEISKVLADQKAYYLFALVDKKPAHTPPLKDIRDQVEKKVVAQEADRLARKQADVLLASLKQGKSIEAIAAENKLKMAETDFFNIGMGTPKLGGARDLNLAIFQLTEKKPYADRVFNANGHYVILQLKEKAKLDDADYTANKENLKKSLLQSRKNDILQVWLEGTKAALISAGKLNISKDLKDL